MFKVGDPVARTDPQTVFAQYSPATVAAFFQTGTLPALRDPALGGDELTDGYSDVYLTELLDPTEINALMASQVLIAPPGEVVTTDEYLVRADPPDADPFGLGAILGRRLPYALAPEHSAYYFVPRVEYDPDDYNTVPANPLELSDHGFLPDYRLEAGMPMLGFDEVLYERIEIRFVTTGSMIGTKQYDAFIAMNGNAPVFEASYSFALPSDGGITSFGGGFNTFLGELLSLYTYIGYSATTSPPPNNVVRGIRIEFGTESLMPHEAADTIPDDYTFTSLAFYGVRDLDP